ncbi:MAG: Subtilase family protein, partial [Solirubrobacterales bacterium]|nr:Subtilase family protein [Solirubrobacterales bacterium]
MGARVGRRRVTASRARRHVCAVAFLVLTFAFLAIAPRAGAEFPYVGDGTAGDPASWALAPGHVPSNLGGLGWKFAATPANPASNPTETQAVAQNNSQQDELCGVTGMSLVDANATFPAGTGSCIAAGTPVKTAFGVTLGRPDVAIGELDSGIKWNEP